MSEVPNRKSQIDLPPCLAAQKNHHQRSTGKIDATTFLRMDFLQVDASTLFQRAGSNPLPFLALLPKSSESRCISSYQIPSRLAPMIRVLDIHSLF